MTAEDDARQRLLQALLVERFYTPTPERPRRVTQAPHELREAEREQDARIRRLRLVHSQRAAS